MRDLRVQTGRNVISESLAGHPDDARSQLRDQRVGLGLGPQSMRGMRGQSLAGALRGGAAGGGRNQAQQVAPERFGGRDEQQAGPRAARWNPRLDLDGDGDGEG